MNEDFLPTLARNTIAQQLGTQELPLDPDPAHLALLQEPGASFVTLSIDGNLRGCIGSLQAHRPLGEDIVANARAAAFSDPRFPPLTAKELAQVEVEVSVLEKPQPLLGKASGFSQAEVLEALRPGVDGVILQYGPARGTFLPQVWKSLPDPEQFLTQLKMKAGLPPDFWSKDIQIFTYTVTEYCL